MGAIHKGNTQPAIDQEEHEHTLPPATKNVLIYGFDGSAKQIVKTNSDGEIAVNLETADIEIGAVEIKNATDDTRATVGANGLHVEVRSTPTVFAVVNTAAAGQSSIVLDTGTKWIGLATTVIGSSPTLFAVVNTAAAGQSSIVLDTGTNWIGLATTVVGSAPTLFAVVNTAAAGQSSIVLDTGSKWIGLATVNLGAAVPAGTNNIGDVDIASIAAGNTNIGDVDVASIAAGNTNIGDVDLASEIPLGTKFIGLVSTASIQGKVQLVANSGVDVGDIDVLSIAAGNNNIGDVDIASIAAGTNYIGLASVNIGGTLPALAAGTAQIGSVTITNQPALTTGSAWIGLASVTVGNTITETNSSSIKTAVEAIDNMISGSEAQVDVVAALPTGTNWVGLATTVIGSAPTLFAVVNTAAAAQASVALDTGSKYIGLVTVANTVPVTGTFWQTTQPVSGTVAATQSGTWDEVGINDSSNSITVDWLSGATVAVSNLPNITIGAAIPIGANYIGLATVTQANQPALVASTAYVGLASVNIGGTLPALAAGTNNIGDVDVLTIAAGTNFIGQATVRIASNNGTDIGDVNLLAGSAWIGLATVRPDFGGDVTVFTGIYSTAGAATVFVAPASNRFFLKSLHIASLGRSEVEIRSGATSIIPFTALATTGGYVHDWDNPGFPSRAQADALVVNLNSAATISVMASTYFRP